MGLGLPRIVVGLLVAGIALRLGWAIAHPVEPVSDYLGYHKHAVTLARYGVYSDEPAYSDAYWPPGWPVVLAAVYFVVGVHPQAGALVGASLEWGAIVIAAVAACRLLRPPFAAGAVAAMCLYPGGIAFAPVLGTEHLTALLFTGLVVLLAFTEPTARTVLAAGALGGALVLTRGDYGLAMAVVIAVWLSSVRPWPRTARLAAVAVAGALVFIGPWTLRNAITFGELAPTSTNGGVNFYLGAVDAEYSEPPAYKRLRPTSTVKPKAHENRYYRLGGEKVADDPLRWLGFVAHRGYQLYSDEPQILYWGRVDKRALVRRLASAYWLVVLALALVGLATTALRRRALPRAWSLIAGSILLVSLLKLAFLVEPRHRLPLVYLLIVVAGLGAQTLSGARRGRAASAQSGRGPRSTPASARRNR